MPPTSPMRTTSLASAEDDAEEVEDAAIDRDGMGAAEEAERERGVRVEVVDRQQRGGSSAQMADAGRGRDDGHATLLYATLPSIRYPTSPCPVHSH